MATDLRVIHAPASGTGPFSAYLWPRNTSVSGKDSLMQKIVKCLFTAPGEYEGDPSFGGDLRGLMTQLTGADNSEATQLINAALQKVVNDLTTEPAPTPQEQLRELRLINASYDMERSSWIVNVQVETADNALNTLEVTA